ncbi:hypothetical protein, partial [Achromobacter xylosoxidans]|uniref:hypothetical protein n=1 Tax=Alcaligenes xylosoxydans xylosoxydans TaxID=85698 RepID=UPI001A953640
GLRRHGKVVSGRPMRSLPLDQINRFAVSVAPSIHEQACSKISHQRHLSLGQAIHPITADTAWQSCS